MTDAPPPGWYPDPSGSGSHRYWNGRKWTGDTQPGDQSSPWRWSGPQRIHHREIVIGWITAFFFPPVGVIMGIRLLKTEERKHGTWMIVVAAAVLALAIIATLS